MKSQRNVAVLHLIRETRKFRVYRTKRGIRIIGKDKNSFPRSRVVPVNDWLLNQTTDSEFDGTVLLEIGIGTFERQ